MNQPQQMLLFGVVIFLAIGLHEYAHCKVAELMGDPTPREQGRVTLNLFKHFDPLGAMMIVVTTISGIGIGWGRPAPVDPSRMKNPRWGFFASVLAGPMCNILQAIVFAIVLRVQVALNIADMSQFLTGLSFIGVLVNLRLALFNLIPIGPLDGHWLLGLLMPKPAMTQWFQFNRRYGSMLLIGFILLSQLMPLQNGMSLLGYILGPPSDFLFRVLTGFPV